MRQDLMSSLYLLSSLVLISSTDHTNAYIDRKARCIETRYGERETEGEAKGKRENMRKEESSELTKYGLQCSALSNNCVRSERARAACAEPGQFELSANSLTGNGTGSGVKSGWTSRRALMRKKLLKRTASSEGARDVAFGDQRKLWTSKMAGMWRFSEKGGGHSGDEIIFVLKNVCPVYSRFRRNNTAGKHKTGKTSVGENTAAHSVKQP